MLLKKPTSLTTIGLTLLMATTIGATNTIANASTTSHHQSINRKIHKTIHHKKHKTHANKKRIYQKPRKNVKRVKKQAIIKTKLTTPEPYKIQRSNGPATPNTGRFTHRTITYHISNMAPKYQKLFKTAITHWTYALDISQTNISLVPAESGQTADIEMHEQGMPDGDDGSMELGEEREATYNENGISIKEHADVYLFGEMFKYTFASKADQQHTTDHEIGHALGLNHASRHAKSLMTPDVNDATNISTADINSLSHLYQNVPDK